jgi:hypothetical protein
VWGGGRGGAIDVALYCMVLYPGHLKVDTWMKEYGPIIGTIMIELQLVMLEKTLVTPKQLTDACFYQNDRALQELLSSSASMMSNHSNTIKLTIHRTVSFSSMVKLTIR